MKISNSISTDKIEEFVDGMIQNKSINFTMIPDYIEKKLYVNVFSIVLNILDMLLDSVNVEIMGHKITIDIASNETETKFEERGEDNDIESQHLIDNYNRMHPVTSEDELSSSTSAEFNRYNC